MISWILLERQMNRFRNITWHATNISFYSTSVPQPDWLSVHCVILIRIGQSRLEVYFRSCNMPTCQHADRLYTCMKPNHSFSGTIFKESGIGGVFSQFSKTFANLPKCQNWNSRMYHIALLQEGAHTWQWLLDSLNFANIILMAA